MPEGNRAKRIRLTMAQALVRFLDNQYVELDGETTKFVNHIFGVFGHGCVVGVGQALSQGGHHIRFLQGKNEQNMALAATAFAKQKNRREIIPCVSSIGPGAMNMVTAAGCATANRIPLLLLPGDTFACRQPDPVLQQAEFFQSYGQTVTDAFRGVCHYFDRIERPEQLITAALHAMRVLTDPADTGAVVKAWFRRKGVRTMNFYTGLYETGLNRALAAFEENARFSHDQMLHIFHFGPVLEAFMRLKASYAPLADGSRCFEIEGETVAITVKNGVPSVSDAPAGEPERLTAMEAQRRFFGLEGFEDGNGLPMGWAPLPLHLEDPDAF